MFLVGIVVEQIWLWTSIVASPIWLCPPTTVIAIVAIAAICLATRGFPFRLHRVLTLELAP